LFGSLGRQDQLGEQVLIGEIGTRTGVFAALGFFWRSWSRSRRRWHKGIHQHGPGRLKHHVEAVVKNLFALDMNWR
jgi:hypothetical protein